MKNIKIGLMFDGTNYHGFQRQKNGITIQECLENAIKKLSGECVQINGCGRTDAGVHAEYYTASFFWDSKIPCEKIPIALNTCLPDDIRIIDAEEADESFHARFSAKGKTYSYKIATGAVCDVFLRNFCWFCPCEPDFDKMRKAAEYFIGTHDFKGFMSSGSPRKTTVRTVKDLTVEKNGDIFDIDITADGFLYNMVRIITGTLLYAGIGRIEPDDIPRIILSGDRREAGITAPPQGLRLKRVYY